MTTAGHNCGSPNARTSACADASRRPATAATMDGLRQT